MSINWNSQTKSKNIEEHAIEKKIPLKTNKFHEFNQQTWYQKMQKIGLYKITAI